MTIVITFRFSLLAIETSKYLNFIYFGFGFCEFFAIKTRLNGKLGRWDGE
jgi:hypothetical protein